MSPSSLRSENVPLNMIAMSCILLSLSPARSFFILLISSGLPCLILLYTSIASSVKGVSLELNKLLKTDIFGLYMVVNIINDDKKTIYDDKIKSSSWI